MKDLDPEQKKIRGQELAEIKNTITPLYQEKEQFFQTAEINEKLKGDLVDIGVNKPAMTRGHFSLLAKVRREVEEICRSFGFIIEYGNEVVSKFENFEAVNIPLTHPATEMHDTIYLEEKDAAGENFILRTHTSSLQNYLIKKHGAPLKAVVP
jgi:phenylalanyl-tRNA synthetase alpha chain